MEIFFTDSPINTAFQEKAVLIGLSVKEVLKHTFCQILLLNYLQIRLLVD